MNTTKSKQLSHVAYFIIFYSLTFTTQLYALEL